MKSDPAEGISSSNPEARAYLFKNSKSKVAGVGVGGREENEGDKEEVILDTLTTG